MQFVTGAFSRLILENCGAPFFDRSQVQHLWTWNCQERLVLKLSTSPWRDFGISRRKIFLNGDASHVLCRLLSFLCPLCRHEWPSCQQMLCVDFSLRNPCSSLFQFHYAASLCCQVEFVTPQKLIQPRMTVTSSVMECSIGLLCLQSHRTSFQVRRR